MAKVAPREELTRRANGRAKDAADRKPDSERPIWDVLLELTATVPPEEQDKIPRDLAENPDRYLYGAPPR